MQLSKLNGPLWIVLSADKEADILPWAEELNHAEQDGGGQFRTSLARQSHILEIRGVKFVQNISKEFNWHSLHGGIDFGWLVGQAEAFKVEVCGA